MNIYGVRLVTDVLIFLYSVSCTSLYFPGGFPEPFKCARGAEREAIARCCLGQALKESATLLLVGVQVTERSGGGHHTPLMMVGLCALSLYLHPSSFLLSLTSLIKPTKNISLIPGI